MVLVYNLTRQKVDMAKWQKLSQLFLDEQGTKGEPGFFSLTSGLPGAVPAGRKIHML